MARCPGQDQRYWKADDIFDVLCPYCGAAIEFWKDEPARVCRDCGLGVRNPRIDVGCAKWCKFAKECLGEHAGVHAAAVPVVERLRHLIARLPQPDAAAQADALHALADTLLAAEGGNPRVVKAAALVAGAALAGADPAPLLAELRHLSIPAADLELLQQALAAALADHPPEPDAPREVAVVSDAARLHRRLCPPPATPNPELPPMATPAGARLAQHRLRPPPT